MFVYERRSWQMQVYKAVFRETPSTCATSIDRGELFGGPEFIDLVVHNDDILARWGTVITYEGRDLSKHVTRFLSGGRYAPLHLTDFSVVDVRRVKTEDLQKAEVEASGLTADVHLSPAVFVVWYDVGVTSVLVWNVRWPQAMRVAVAPSVDMEHHYQPL
ncbi:hypothetical protein Poli38472_003740 [Pythium oligandrum]|uniref:Uncharacterized protein n=1 Tax=Pythium oligandrum TaxID=41045 RepID=A0A8K1CNR0_PYTOL|nr:hypothetical protein Poli38472_003740 [Pythium oligandrum]|eukprot:TMW65975.1 hypothetical protein Poli38472_003740 [Pythium oligandrum]